MFREYLCGQVICLAVSLPTFLHGPKSTLTKVRISVCYWCCFDRKAETQQLSATVKKINFILSRPRPGDIQGPVQGRCWCSHHLPTQAVSCALLALTPRLSVTLCFGWPGDSNRAGPQLPALLLVLQGERRAGKASAVVSAHGRRERGSSGSRENSDSLSLGRNQGSQVMSAQKTSCRGDSSSMCGEGGGEGSPW